MKIDRKGLKAQAKQAIRAAAPVFWLVTLVYLLLTEGLSTVVGWLAPTFQPADLLWGGTVGWLSLFISILLTLYLWVMDFGYRLWALRVTRSQQAGYGTLLEGFGIAGRVIAMNLLILLFTFLWSLLLIFVTTILAFFVLDSLFLQLLVMAGIYAAVFAIMLRYAMAPYLLADYPDDGAGAAVRRSGRPAHPAGLSALPHRYPGPGQLGRAVLLRPVQSHPGRWSGLPDQSAPHPVADPLPHGGGGPVLPLHPGGTAGRPGDGGAELMSAGMWAQRSR